VKRYLFVHLDTAAHLDDSRYLQHAIPCSGEVNLSLSTKMN